MRAVNHDGEKFNMLTIVTTHHEKRGAKWYSLARCDCGETTVASSNNIISGGVKSCGCRKHGTSPREWMRDYDGERFGLLVVIETRHSFRKSANGTKWSSLVLCDCGAEKVVRLDHLKGGDIVSCGCYGRKVHVSHGLSNDMPRVYRAWKDMISRCAVTASEETRGKYRDQGIAVCPEWYDSFDQFRADMGEPPEGLTLDRINPHLGYFKENCRWADLTIQARNQKKRRIETSSKYKGVMWSKQKGKWHAVIHLGRDGGRKHLGFFTDETEAACAYNAEASKHEGFFLNKIEQ